MEEKTIWLDFDILFNDVIVLWSIVQNEVLRSFNGKSEAIRDKLGVFFLFLFDDFFNTSRVVINELGILDNVLDKTVAGVDITSSKFFNTFVDLVLKVKLSSDSVIRTFSTFLDI